MFGFWLPIGLVIASVGLFAVATAKQRNRLTAKTYRLTTIIWSVAAVTLSIGSGWSSYEMEQTLTRLEDVKARANALQNHINAVKARQQLMHFADPLQQADPLPRHDQKEEIQRKALSVSDESDALAQNLFSARSQFDELNRARIGREFILFLCVVVVASAFTLGIVYWGAVRRRRPGESTVRP